MKLLSIGYVSVGVIIGLFMACVLFLFFPSNAVRSPIAVAIPKPEILASALGAIIGGMISALVAKSTFERASDQQLKRDQAERAAIRKSQASVLLIKILQALDRVQKAHNYYRTFDHSAVVEITEINIELDSKRMIAQLWKPLEGKRKNIDLGLEEMAFLLDEKALTAYNQVTDLEGALSNCECIESLYHKYFEAFQEGQRNEGKVDVLGKRVVSEGSFDELGLRKVQDALDKLRAALSTTLPLGYSSLALVQDLIEKSFGQRIEFKIDVSINGVAEYAR